MDPPKIVINKRYSEKSFDTFSLVVIPEVATLLNILAKVDTKLIFFIEKKSINESRIEIINKDKSS